MFKALGFLPCTKKKNEAMQNISADKSVAF
jgi:hypothetical protein